MTAAGTLETSDAKATKCSTQQDPGCALLRLPSQLLERVVLMAGTGGAGACYSCRTMAEAWRSVTTPSGSACYLQARWVRFLLT